MAKLSEIKLTLSRLVYCLAWNSAMNVYLVSILVGVPLGILSRRFDRVFKILLVLAIPASWLFAYFAPTYTSLPRANQDGFLNFYFKLYERLSPDGMLAVLMFPAFVILGRIIYLIYLAFFKKEKVETPMDIKKRVLKSFGYS